VSDIRSFVFLLGLAIAVTANVVTAMPKTKGASALSERTKRPPPDDDNMFSAADATPHPFADAEALRVAAEEVLLFQGPDLDAPRRGALRRGTEVWAYGHARGKGCVDDWVLVGPSAWACDGPGQFDGREGTHGSPKNEPLTHRFVKIARNGSGAYKSWAKAVEGLPEADLEPGFFLGVVEERSTSAERFLRTTHDLWIATNDTIPIAPSAFAGMPLDVATTATTPLGPYLPVGWIYVDRARAHGTIDGPKRGPGIERLSPLTIDGYGSQRGKNWFHTPIGWFDERQLRVPKREPPPEGLQPGERWIDVSVETQTLVAYRGSDPVFATLVSTGREGARSDTGTPKGVHRIWVKLLWSDMDNLEVWTNPSSEAASVRPYDVEAVSWVMYFLGGYGLHGTYWHDRFGVPQSHGCVNVSLRDAEYLFQFTSPSLGPGWQAAHPSDHDPATIVRVH
jgi:hypothetical protein